MSKIIICIILVILSTFNIVADQVFTVMILVILDSLQLRFPMKIAPIVLRFLK
mgnify:CR=1 FL=1